MVETESELSRIDQYFLTKKIGEGGYGDAYKAYDDKTKKVVCVKIFHNHSPKFQEVWETELEPAKKRFDHENVLKVICAGQGKHIKRGVSQGTKLYIVSEFACNGELYELIESVGGLNPEMSRYVFTQLLNAIEYVHE